MTNTILFLRWNILCLLDLISGARQIPAPGVSALGSTQAGGLSKKMISVSLSQTRVVARPLSDFFFFHAAP